MLYREIMAVCSEIHTKHINALCGLNVELLNVKPCGRGTRLYIYIYVCVCVCVCVCVFVRVCYKTANWLLRDVVD